MEKNMTQECKTNYNLEQVEMSLRIGLDMRFERVCAYKWKQRDIHTSQSHSDFTAVIPQQLANRALNSDFNYICWGEPSTVLKHQCCATIYVEILIKPDCCSWILPIACKNKMSHYNIIKVTSGDMPAKVCWFRFGLSWCWSGESGKSALDIKDALWRKYSY